MAWRASLPRRRRRCRRATSGSASKDLYECIEKGDYPQWDLSVQIMEDSEHAELEWDPLDDTKIWPEKDFPLRHVGVMTLNRNVEDVHNENEQIAMGTGVLVDGLDFSDDKMLVGRTFLVFGHAASSCRTELSATAGEPAQGLSPVHESDGRHDVVLPRSGARAECAREL